MIFVLDNYDSFTYNLVQYLGELGQTSQVARNDAVSVQDILAADPDALLVSPGPCTPAEAGISVAAIRQLAGRIPVLGVCLGHQAIGVAEGGRLLEVEPMHGKLSQVHHQSCGLFDNIPSPFTATRYHSLVLDPQSLPDSLVVDAWTQTADGQRHIMGMHHSRLPLWGVQFHPESILTENGRQILGNFLHLIGVD